MDGDSLSEILKGLSPFIITIHSIIPVIRDFCAFSEISLTQLDIFIKIGNIKLNFNFFSCPLQSGGRMREEREQSS